MDGKEEEIKNWVCRLISGVNRAVDAANRSGSNPARSTKILKMRHDLYNTNGLIFWSGEELKYRRFVYDTLAEQVKNILLSENKAWQFHEIEAPLITPRDLINQNYTPEDIWVLDQDNLVLRPETTPSSYVYAQHILNSNSGLPPFVVYQSGKSFRKEQDQVTKNMRLKEFYQMEFQCIYTSDTMNDYQTKVLEPMAKCLSRLVGNMECRIVESDRLPSYSLKTMDIEVFNGSTWMELCSISKRTDFPQKVKFEKKGGGVVERDLIVLEIAVGLDRVVYNYFS